MTAIKRELYEATRLALRMHAISRNPLLANPAALKPHMHCGYGQQRLFPDTRV